MCHSGLEHLLCLAAQNSWECRGQANEPLNKAPSLKIYHT